MGWVVLWAMPGGWVHVELQAVDLDDRVAAMVRANSADAGLDTEAVEELVAAQVELAHLARDAGVLLWAAFGEGAGTLDDPLSLLTLTLALGDLPKPDEDLIDQLRTSLPHGGASSAQPAMRPLVVDDPELTAFVQERRPTVRPPGSDLDLTQFQVQVFLVSPRAGLVLVLTVTTTDPAREDQARAVAREVANTITTIEVETEAA